MKKVSNLKRPIIVGVIVGFIGGIAVGFAPWMEKTHGEPLSPAVVKTVKMGNNIRITWDEVPGAKSYNVYSAICLPDTTFMVSYAHATPDPITGKTTWLYRASWYPRYGDVHTEQYVEDPLDWNIWGEAYVDPKNMDVFMWGSPQSRAKEIELEVTLFGPSSTTYTRPLEGRDRMFMITAVW